MTPIKRKEPSPTIDIKLVKFGEIERMRSLVTFGGEVPEMISSFSVGRQADSEITRRCYGFEGWALRLRGRDSHSFKGEIKSARASRTTPMYYELSREGGGVGAGLILRSRPL